MEIIDGNKIAEKIKDKIVKDVLALNEGKIKFQNAEVRPNLAIILIGENKESELYVNKKLEESKKVGIDTHLYRFSNENNQEEIIKTIEILNLDEEIDGILVQLPLSNKFDTNVIIRAINPEKDVDCFHPDNKGELIVSPVYGAVLEIIEKANWRLQNKKVLIIANSEIFGEKLKKILGEKGAKSENILFTDSALNAKIKEADLVISAVGKPHYLNDGMFKKGVGVIDIGIFREGKKIKGDLNPENIENVVDFYTPVPGGVGPITVAILLKNTLALFKKRNNLK